MVAAAARQSFHIPFSRRIQLRHAADAGEAFARAGLLDYEGVSVHNLDGAVMAVEEVASLIERALPGHGSPSVMPRSRSSRRSTGQASSSSSAGR
jgi:hypothetical protein